jgi:hypothetical protein
MVDDQHEAEDLVQLSGLVGVLLTLEERNKDVVLPVVIQAALFLVDLINLQD